MILDLDKFITKERPYWDELTAMLQRLDNRVGDEMSLTEAKRFHYLYQRASSDLVKLQTFAGEVEMTQFLENLVSRAYGRLHSKRGSAVRFQPWHWLTVILPATFRRHVVAFWISLACLGFGVVFGMGVMWFAPQYKTKFIPAQFGHLDGTPSDRVAREEAKDFDGLDGRSTFASQLMTNNIRVTILAMVFGMLLGVGTIYLLVSNGVILGIVIADYILDGESVFLTAWLLPHGSTEIPAIILGGQCGLMVAHALVGWGTSLRLAQRFRAIRSDLLTIIGGAALLLVWAAVVESFLSQYHSPELYPFKIGFGVVHLLLLFGYLFLVGRRARSRKGI